MFDLLAPKKLRSTHSRSQSTPYISSSFSNPLSSDDPSANNRHGCPSLSEHTAPQPPALAHPPTFDPSSDRHLPPLITRDVQHTQPKKSSKLTDWFTGESEPITLSIVPSPTKEKPDPVDAMPESPVQGRQSEAKPAFISRFSLFGAKPSSTKPSTLPSDLHDEWYDLDVKTALSSPNPISPSAIINLQQDAESLLSKLQAAYKQRSQVLKEVIAEKEAQAEEMEGAEMRSKHLKLQLDDMTAKLAEQDKAMMDLVDEVAQEKQARREYEIAREKEKQWKSRKSTASDMSTKSEDSCAESLFSRHGATSPTMSMSSISTMNSPDSSHQTPSTNHKAHTSGTRQADKAPPTAQCNNCNGLKSSEAWSLVNMLKMENTGLKARLVQLENTVDDCLDMVKGLF
ncbi:MAG: hypothetical protein Q9222_007617 [Ikaeria aurantiellina]